MDFSFDKEIIIDLMSQFLKGIEDYPKFYEDSLREGTVINDFFYDYGATKGVFIPNKTNPFPYVVKIPFNWSSDYDDWMLYDYCEIEESFANKADEDLRRIFLPTIKVGEYSSIPLYLQRKIDEPYLFALRKKKKKDYRDYLIEQNAYYLEAPLSDSLAGEICMAYGAETLKKVVRFIEDNEINDLHGGNWGFFNNKPVIFDYCGYLEGEFPLNRGIV